MGQGSQYAALIVKHSLAVQKAVTSGNAEGRWKVKKMKNVIKEIGKVMLFAVGVNAPFWAYMLGWL